VSACRRHENDVGSTEVQIAQTSARIVHLTKHLQANRKDFATQRGLVAILSRRKRLMKYLYREDQQAFARCVRDLNIRNPLKGVNVVMKEDENVLPGFESPTA
jgi:small subunit ribosomal protein S15